MVNRSLGTDNVRLAVRPNPSSGTSHTVKHRRREFFIVDGLVAPWWARTQIRTARQGPIPFPWSFPIECHKGLVGLARRRSDLFTASSESRLARNHLVCRFEVSTV